MVDSQMIPSMTMGMMNVCAYPLAPVNVFMSEKGICEEHHAASASALWQHEGPQRRTSGILGYRDSYTRKTRSPTRPIISGASTGAEPHEYCTPDQVSPMMHAVVAAITSAVPLEEQYVERDGTKCTSDMLTPNPHA